MILALLLKSCSIPQLIRLGIAALLSLASITANGQDALRYSLAGEQTARQRRLALEYQPYNMKAGPVRLLLNSSLNLELNDNVNLTELDRKADLIIRPQFGLAAMCPVTELNALTLNLGVGYVKYLKQTQNDYFLLTPGSDLSFDAFISDFRLNFHDRFSYTQDPTQQGAISSTGQFGGLDNSVGLGVDWDLSKIILSVGYDHHNFISATTQYEYLNKGSELFSSRATYRANSTVTLGLEASGGLNTYDQPVLRDSDTYSFGAFANWQINSYLQSSLRGGYVAYWFYARPPSQPGQDTTSYYLGLTLNHQPNELFSHSLDVSRQLELGINADLLQLWTIRHQMNLRVIQKIGIGTVLFFEMGNETGSGLPERYRRYGASVYLSHQLMAKVTTRLGYRFIYKNSDRLDRDYTQNSVFVEATYAF